MRLIDVHLDALWNHDAQGDLTGSNEPNPTPAPRLHVGKDARGYVLRIGRRLTPVLREAVRRLPLRQVFADEEIVTGLLAQDEPCTRIWRGPAYYFAEPVREGAFPQARLLTASDATLLTEEMAAFCGFPDTRRPSDSDGGTLQSAPMYGVVVDGRIVACCYSSRITPLADEAGVETDESFRRRGYGRQAVLAWAYAVQRQGKLALYSTNWDNAASRALASGLGLAQYGEDVEYF